MADTLGGNGSVVINRGVSGFPADKDLFRGTGNILDKYPDIKIAAEVYGKWDNAVSQQELTKVLTAQPKVDGVSQTVVVLPGHPKRQQAAVSTLNQGIGRAKPTARSDQRQ
jgi:hypothetical protein